MPMWKHWRWGWGAFAVLWGCAVGLLWSWVVWTWDLAVLGMLTRYPYRALCVQSDSARKWSTGSMEVTLGDSEVWSWPSLSTGVSWISVFSEVYRYRRCWMHGFILSLWAECVFVVVGGVDRLCGCVPCLRYPRKGNTPRVYYIIIIIYPRLSPILVVPQTWNTFTPLP